MKYLTVSKPPVQRRVFVNQRLWVSSGRPVGCRPMALSSFDIDTPMAYHVVQQNIVQRLDAGEAVDDVREQWQQTIDRIVDTRVAGDDALVFVRAPEPGPDR